MHSIKFRQRIKSKHDVNDYWHYWGYVNEIFYDPIHKDDCPSYQYTGLKDKNGKEIWEGDIIRCRNIATPIGVKRFQIVFKDAGFIGKREDESDFWTICVLTDPINIDLEVIGNIYENKDLLEETKCGGEKA